MQMRDTKRPPLWLTRLLWTAVIFLALIGIGAAIHRAAVLVLPRLQAPSGNPAHGLDKSFGSHPVLMFVHIIPGILFMVLGPLQFAASFRRRQPRFHRWSGRAFLLIGFIIGTSALAMSFTSSIGGANERAATMYFAAFFLIALGKAYVHIRRRRFALHREWMVRAFAIGLAIATIRPIVGAFFAARSLSPHEFFGIAFWLGFTTHLIAAEIWINYTRAFPSVALGTFSRSKASVDLLLSKRESATL
jgi:uncharacterized membrane protein